MKNSLGIAAAIVAFTLLGGGAIYLLTKFAAPPAPFDALAEAERFELFSLDPEEQRFVDPHFNCWEILGSTEIAEPKTRELITEALSGAASWGDPEIACFEPRHGIRIRHGDETIDYVICFHCEYVHVLKNGDPAGGFLIDPSGQRVLDDVLRAAKVKLPRPG